MRKFVANGTNRLPPFNTGDETQLLQSIGLAEHWTIIKWLGQIVQDGVKQAA